jgi:hypothetical protein
MVVLCFGGRGLGGKMSGSPALSELQAIEIVICSNRPQAMIGSLRI